MHEQGYTFNGDAPIAGLLKVEADALVLGQLIHNDPDGGGLKGEYRRKHRQRTAEIIDDINNTA